MNIFFVIGDGIVTPPLSGSILPGVTRDSVLTITRDWGMNVSERRIGMQELRRVGVGARGGVAPPGGSYPISRWGVPDGFRDTGKNGACVRGKQGDRAGVRRGPVRRGGPRGGLRPQRGDALPGGGGERGQDGGPGSSRPGGFGMERGCRG